MLSDKIMLYYSTKKESLSDIKLQTGSDFTL